MKLQTKLKVGDSVQIISGVNKGFIGNIERFIQKKNRLCVFVEGASFCYKHVKPDPNTGEKGGIKKIAKPVDVSNVMLYNNSTNKRTKVKFAIVDGNKCRVHADDNQLIDSSLVKADKS